MQRFVSRRSSSSVDLDSSSLDDLRAERAAVALSVGLSWPPHRRRRSAGRPSWQQLWERALQEHILHHHELPRAVRIQRPGWRRPGDAIARPLSHEEIANVSTRSAPLPPTPAAALVEDEPSSRAAKRRKVQVDPFVRDWFLDMSCHWKDRTTMGHVAVLVRSPASVPRVVRRDQPEYSVPLETERATRSTARQEDLALTRHDAAERAHPACDRRPVPQRGDDNRHWCTDGSTQRNSTCVPAILGPESSCMACA